MKKKEELILMYKDLEVLSFLVDYDNSKIKFLDKLEHFDKAPYGFNEEGAIINSLLTRFIGCRSINVNRCDYKKIIEATNCKDGFELSFKGHGLSLTNHYWFKRKGENLKYKNINFFENKWDDSFARAVLKGDYASLSHCDLNVPDVVTDGWSVKGWIYDNGPKLYKLGIVEDHSEDCIGEVLASRLARRILKEDEVVHYELKEINGRYASVSPLITNIDEELVPLSRVLPPRLSNIYYSKYKDKRLAKMFFDEIAEFGMPELFEFFTKLTCIRSISFVGDLHFENISLIHNTKTDTYRVAPLYDLAGAFGSSRGGRETLANLNKGTYLIVYFLYGGLEPDWDYSWYDPNKLIGFEDEIREYLSKSAFYTPELIERIIQVYQYQKSSLDDMARKQRESE